MADVEQIMTDPCSGPSSVAPATGLATGEMEYEAQFLGFSPQSFIDTLYNRMLDVVSTSLEYLKNAMIKSFAGSVPEDGITNSVKSFAGTVEESMDAGFVKFSMYAKRKIFYIPNHVVLPQDQLHLDAAEKDSVVYVDKLKTEVSDLQKRALALTLINRELEKELEEIEATEAAISLFEAELDKAVESMKADGEEVERLAAEATSLVTTLEETAAAIMSKNDRCC